MLRWDLASFGVGAVSYFERPAAGHLQARLRQDLKLPSDERARCCSPLSRPRKLNIRASNWVQRCCLFGTRTTRLGIMREASR